jgi:hypothetical protein
MHVEPQGSVSHPFRKGLHTRGLILAGDLRTA